MKKTIFYFKRMPVTHQIIQYQLNYNNGDVSEVKKIDYQCMSSD